jgi:hypothetical protein
VVASLRRGFDFVVSVLDVSCGIIAASISVRVLTPSFSAALIRSAYSSSSAFTGIAVLGAAGAAAVAAACGGFFNPANLIDKSTPAALNKSFVIEDNSVACS